MTYYNGFTYEWLGRQLIKAIKDGVEYSFAYNADGLRTSKTVEENDVEITTNYYYSDSQLIAEETSGNITVYLYDASGSIIGMQYHAAGSASTTWDTYWFEKNLQGDVVAIYNSVGAKLISYTYDAWGNFTPPEDSTSIPAVVTNNPFTYRGYYYDYETGFYYVSSRYYDPEIGRWINADDTTYLGADGTPLSYNLFAYCKNNPVMGYDPSGTFDWGSLAQGGGWLATGIAALVVGVSVLTCGVATPLMVGVALATAGAGALTVANGASEIGEAFTGYNVMRDGVFQGNATAYNAYAYSTAAVAQVGTAICGGWSAKNAPRIEAYNNIQNYKYADGAAKHIGQRSYYDSTLLQKQIIKYGSMTSEGNGVYTFRVAGSSFNVARQLMHQGTWELTTINSMKLIGHFLLDY